MHSAKALETRTPDRLRRRFSMETVRAAGELEVNEKLHPKNMPGASAGTLMVTK